jgi:hypothetical protein
MAAGIALLWLAPLVYSVPNYGIGEGLRTNVQLTADYVQRIIEPRLEAHNAVGLGGSRAPNNSFAAVMHRYFSEGQKLSLYGGGRSPLLSKLPDSVVGYAGLALAALLGALAMLLAWRTREHKLGRSAVFGLALLSAALANLLFWPHHLCLLLIVLAPLAASCMGERRMRPALLAVGSALVLCYLPLVASVSFFNTMAVWGTPTLGVLIIWGVAFIHFWRRSVARGAAPHILPADEETQSRNSAA